MSTPVSWRQLTARLSPGTYTVIGWRTLAGPRDPWHDYWTTRQTISAAAFRAITELRPST